jgi:ADP-heptose:LPS heptosyltransferase
VAAVAAADVHIGPVSGPVHIAAAVGTPSVVIYGGYEHPVCSSYERNVNLYSAVECSPCFLREPCPYHKKCLTRIAVDEVSAAIETILARRSQPIGDHVTRSPWTR